MPLLLRPSPVARRALVWRHGSREVIAAASHPLAPLAAVRHLFRDHSSDAQDGPFNGLHGSHHHRQDHDHDRHQQHHGHHQHHHLHHRHPSYRKAPELASDWASLYLGAKLALWSGLCYYPYDTLSRTLQEEGLKLVAYGRTSYTCWYVADGYVDFEALPRRGFPGRQSHPSARSQQQHHHHNHHHQQQQQQVVGEDGAVEESNTTTLAADVSSSVTSGAAKPGGLAEAYGTSNGSDVLLQRQQQPGQRQRGRQPPVLHSSHVHGSGAYGHSSSSSSSGHTLRDGHIHLHREQPALHLSVHAHPKGRTAPQSHGGSGGGGDGTANGDGWNGASDLTAGSAAAGTAPPDSQQLSTPTAAVTPGTRCRFIFLRGVQWAAPETNTLSLSASLAAFWPVPLLPPNEAAALNGNGAAAAVSPSSSSTSRGSTSSSSEHLVAHSGVAAMARELLPVLLPYIIGASSAGAAHLVLAGHSLGGSLAQLLWALSVQQGHRSPHATSCHTFGSPPVLAHAAGGGGARVLRLLRAPPAAAVHWVLEYDPVPRAMLTADPYFAAARRAVPGLSALLALRGAVLGEGAALSSGRFLYETAGELLLLRWSARGGCEVVPVSETEAESLLHMALDQAITAPVRSLQYWLDHLHASYHHDLEAAALAAYRQLARSQRAGQGAELPQEQELSQEEQQGQQLAGKAGS